MFIRESYCRTGKNPKNDGFSEYLFKTWVVPIQTMLGLILSPSRSNGSPTGPTAPLPLIQSPWLAISDLYHDFPDWAKSLGCIFLSVWFPLMDSNSIFSSLRQNSTVIPHKIPWNRSVNDLALFLLHRTSIWRLGWDLNFTHSLLSSVVHLLQLSLIHIWRCRRAI